MPVVKLTYDHVISSQWKIHRQFLEEVESYLTDIVDKWHQQAQGIEDEEERKFFYEVREDAYSDICEYHDILLNSFFSTSLALFEHQLVRLCDSAQRREKTPFSVKDLGSRNYMDNAKTYLKRLDVKFPADTSEWSNIRIYQEIRNKIIHEGGYVPCRWGHFDYAKKKGIISNGGIRLRLELTRQICEEAVRDFEKFIMMVYKAVDDMGKGT